MMQYLKITFLFCVIQILRFRRWRLMQKQAAGCLCGHGVVIVEPKGGGRCIQCRRRYSLKQYTLEQLSWYYNEAEKEAHVFHQASDLEITCYRCGVTYGSAEHFSTCKGCNGS